MAEIPDRSQEPKIDPVVMRRIFVSHSSHDNDFGIRLVESLRRVLGDDAVWYDVHGGLYGGDFWWRKIMEEVKARNVFIVVLSPSAQTSPWVNSEIDMAWRQMHSPTGKLIIPVLYQSCDIREDLATLQIISFLPPKPFREAFSELLLALESLPISPNDTNILPFEPRMAARAIPRRVVVTGLAGLAIAGGVSGIVWLVLSQTLNPRPKSAPNSPALGTTLLIYRGHSGWVPALAWSPDGQRIASGSGDTTVQVWNASTGSKVLTYRGHSSNVNGVPWSPDGRRIASGSSDWTVQVWDATTGSKVLTYRSHTDVVRAVAWSPNGQRIASASHDMTVRVWDASNGNTVLTCKGHHDRVTSVAWSPDGTRIASGSDDQTVRVWNASSGATILTYPGHSDTVESVTWSPDNTRIASGSHDRTAQVWSGTTGNNVFIYRGHSDWIGAVGWSPDGKHIASGSTDRTVQVWNASSGSTVLTYRGHSNEVNAVGWSPDSVYIASGGIDTTVQVWRV